MEITQHCVQQRALVLSALNFGFITRDIVNNLATDFTEQKVTGSDTDEQYSIPTEAGKILLFVISWGPPSLAPNGTEGSFLEGYPTRA
jgi:hypothetical protein